jgi:hypothetical protein
MSNRPHRPTTEAHLLIDLGDLYRSLATDSFKGGHVLKDLQIALERLPDHVLRTLRATVRSARAFADFSAVPGAELFTLRALASFGIAPVHVDEQRQNNASELALTIEALSLPAGSTVVVASGTRAYLPLIDTLTARGYTVVRYVTDVPSGSITHLGHSVRTESIRELMPMQEAPAPREPRNVEHLAVEDESALKTLEIIEEFFGQYDEIYLTPLLRKITESDLDVDPKDVIADLEKAGAVYLEKRRGYPHDYTVLLVDAEHPDVIRVRDLFEDEDEPDYTYDEDEDVYDDEYVAEDDPA